MPDFIPFQKIPRFSRDIIITEKSTEPTPQSTSPQKGNF